MFATCFTPKPARSGATAQLSVVGQHSQKYGEGPIVDARSKNSTIASKVSERSTAPRDLLSKLNGSSEKR
jgi:hypothetical protein